MATSLTKADVSEAKQLIWDQLSKGVRDMEIIERLGVEAETYVSLKAQMLDDKAEELKNKPSEHVYIEYCLAQHENIHTLTEMIKDFKSTKQYNAMVGAVRARADLQDKLIAKGQEFGVYKKTPAGRVIGGLLVADLSSSDLKSAITKAIGNLDKMINRYGDSDIIDVPSSSVNLHYGPALPPPSMLEEPSSVVAPKGRSSKTFRAKTSRTSKASRGRKRFKERD